MHQFIFPPTVHKDSVFSTSSLTLVTSCLFDNSHSDRYEVILVVVSICISMYLSAICISSLEKYLFGSIFKVDYLFFLLLS